MTRRPARHRSSALLAIAVVALTTACGSGDDGADADPGGSAPEPAAAASGGSGGERPSEHDAAPADGCVLDEAAVSEAVGVEMIVVGDCDFAAGAAAGEAVTWSIELYVDPTVPEALDGGTPVAGLGDGAAWNDGLGVLSVRAGDRYFQVQPLRLGDAPVELGAEELARAVAEMVLARG